MPMHLVNKMGDPDAPDERFVDVFAGGALLTRCAAAEPEHAQWLCLASVFHEWVRDSQFPA